MLLLAHTEYINELIEGLLVLSLAGGGVGTWLEVVGLVIVRVVIQLVGNVVCQLGLDDLLVDQLFLQIILLVKIFHLRLESSHEFIDVALSFE